MKRKKTKKTENLLTNMKYFGFKYLLKHAILTPLYLQIVELCLQYNRIFDVFVTPA